MPIKTFFKKMYFSNIILGLLFSFSSLSLWANETHAGDTAHAAPVATESAQTTAPAAEAGHEAAAVEKFDPGKLIMHHIADEHEWHFFTIGHTHVTLPLPCIVYSPSQGLLVFSENTWSPRFPSNIIPPDPVTAILPGGNDSIFVTTLKSGIDRKSVV